MNTNELDLTPFNGNTLRELYPPGMSKLKMSDSNRPKAAVGRALAKHEQFAVLLSSYGSAMFKAGRLSVHSDDDPKQVEYEADQSRFELLAFLEENYYLRPTK